MAACNDLWLERISACHDGEAAAEERSAVERHLLGCASCAATSAQMGALGQQLRGLSQLQADSEARSISRVSAAVENAHPRPRKRSSWSRRPLLGAVAAALAVLIAWSAWPFGFNDALASDLERNHLKAFSHTKPCEFESSDPNAVQAWVEAQVGYPVEVPDVEGAALLGARRCQVKGELTAAVLYRKGEHALTFFVPGPKSSTAEEVASFADGKPRCTEGPHGEKICVNDRADRPLLAVSDLDEPVLLSVLSAAQR